jgi:hypothetical protein
VRVTAAGGSPGQALGVSGGPLTTVRHPEIPDGFVCAASLPENDNSGTTDARPPRQRLSSTRPVFPNVVGFTLKQK